MKKCDFYIFPTLVDSFLWYQKMQTPDKFQEVIDKINRIKYEMPEFVLKGSALEDCVNLRLTGQRVYSKDGFDFNPDLIDKLASKLQNNTGQQVWIENTVDFKYGKLRVGGFVDYMYNDKHVDLKTTTRYKLGKYKDSQQSKCYGLIQPDKKEFIYLATDFENYYIEPYKNKKENHEEFIFNCEELFIFVQENEHLITDLKIYGGSKK